MSRRLVTIRKVDDINPIPNADAIEVASIGGWQVVTKKGEFSPGSYCLYFEIDSFLPTGNPAWQFLVDKQGREFEGVYGHRLRTIKLRGQLSQGFIAPISSFPKVVEFALARKCDGHFCENDYAELMDEDFSQLLGVKKWEASLPAQLAGQAEGLFPSFIRKTDQERCQNLVNQIFQYDDELVDFSITAQTMVPEALKALEDKGIIQFLDGRWMKTNKAQASPFTPYEVTMKMDGSSMTVFARQDRRDTETLADIAAVESGVCSRNLQLKISDANKDNSFVRMAVDSSLLSVLQALAREEGLQLAVQGELMGPGIQGNRENLKDFTFFVFDIQDLSTGQYLSVYQRYSIMDKLYARGVNPFKLRHVPIMIEPGKFVDFRELAGDERIGHMLDKLNISNVKDLLAFAEGPSLVNPVREGLVFKQLDGSFSFKAISNAYLLKGGD